MDVHVTYDGNDQNLVPHPNDRFKGPRNEILNCGGIMLENMLPCNLIHLS